MGWGFLSGLYGLCDLWVWGIIKCWRPYLSNVILLKGSQRSWDYKLQEGVDIRFKDYPPKFRFIH